MHAIPRGGCRQMLPNLWLGGLRALAVATLCVYALGAAGSPPPAQAIDLSDGDLRLTLDTTLSHGLTFRIQDRDDLLAGDVNGNDGDLNYDRGLVSNTSKFTTDLDLGYHNFGAFLRLNGFLDFENEHGERARTPLSDEAKELVGQDIILLDAYLTGAFDIGNVAIDLRLGSHVLNWGESTFIQNGINAINPFDVSKLRLPGSELREGLLPVPMVSASVALSDTLTMEGFYQTRLGEDPDRSGGKLLLGHRLRRPRGGEGGDRAAWTGTPGGHGPHAGKQRLYPHAGRTRHSVGVRLPLSGAYARRDALRAGCSSRMTNSCPTS